MSKKPDKAAALSYEHSDEAPKIIALGKGEVASRIIDTARKNNVPVFEDSGLVEVLTKMEIGQQIPPELYSVVAGILVFISKLDKLKGGSNGE